MQSQSHVTVAEVDANGMVGRVTGQAVLVAPDVAVMRVVNRETVPALPLVVLVPVAAGGDRDERFTVTEVAPATNGSPFVALRLEREYQGWSADDADTRRLVAAIDPEAAAELNTSAASLSTMTSSITATGKHWLCRIFRIC